MNGAQYSASIQIFILKLQCVQRVAGAVGAH